MRKKCPMCGKEKVDNLLGLDTCQACGWVFYPGEFDPKKYEEETMLHAAENHDPIACNNIARIAAGREMWPIYALYGIKAAEAGIAYAANMAACAYQDGLLFGEKDPEKAHYWFKKGVEYGVEDAIHNLGRDYVLGKHGVEANPDKAIELLSPFEGEDVRATSNLGIAYLMRSNSLEDLKKSKQLLTMAAEAGVAQAQYFLSAWHMKAPAEIRDPEESCYWMEQAAINGNIAAQYYIADMYRKGIGTIPDINRACFWCNIAAHNGHGEAQLYLSALFFEGRGVYRRFGDALFWCRKAIDKNTPNAKELMESYTSSSDYPGGWGSTYFDLWNTSEFLLKNLSKLDIDECVEEFYDQLRREPNIIMLPDDPQKKKAAYKKFMGHFIELLNGVLIDIPHVEKFLEHTYYQCRKPDSIKALCIGIKGEDLIVQHIMDKSIDAYDPRYDYHDSYNVNLHNPEEARFSHAGIIKESRTNWRIVDIPWML